MPVKTPPWLDRERMEARGDAPMTNTELIDELEFLIRAGVAPDTAAEQLGRSWQDLRDIAYKLGRKLPRRDRAEDSRYRIGRAS